MGFQFFFGGEYMVWDVRAGQLITVHNPVSPGLEGLQGFIRRVRRKFSPSLTDGPIDVWLPRYICDHTFSFGRSEGVTMSFLPSEIKIAEGLTWRSVHNFLQYLQLDGRDIDLCKVFATELRAERRRMNGGSRTVRR